MECQLLASVRFIWLFIRLGIRVSPNAAVPSSSSKPGKRIVQAPSIPRRKASSLVKQADDVVNVKPSQQSGSQYDVKLIEMIDTLIVDRSPSVKWDDVGRNLAHHLFFCTFLRYSITC